MAPNETTEAFNNDEALVLTSLSHLAGEFIVMTFVLFLNDFVKELRGCRPGVTGAIKRRVKKKRKRTLEPRLAHSGQSLQSRFL